MPVLMETRTKRASRNAMIRRANFAIPTVCGAHDMVGEIVAQDGDRVELYMPNGRRKRYTLRVEEKERQVSEPSHWLGGYSLTHRQACLHFPISGAGRRWISLVWLGFPACIINPICTPKENTRCAIWKKHNRCECEQPTCEWVCPYQGDWSKKVGGGSGWVVEPKRNSLAKSVRPGRERRTTR